MSADEGTYRPDFRKMREKLSAPSAGVRDDAQERETQPAGERYREACRHGRAGSRRLMLAVIEDERSTLADLHLVERNARQGETYAPDIAEAAEAEVARRAEQGGSTRAPLRGMSEDVPRVGDTVESH